MSYFIDICLICLKHSNNFKCIESRDTNGLSFEDKLEDFLPEYELDLNIPTYICAQCGRNLSRIYEFKRKCLQNKTTYKKYAQQITTADGSNKYLSVVINPDLMSVKEEISNENDYNLDILEYQTGINVDTENSDEFIIKEEGNEELILDEKSQSLLHEIKKEIFDSDDTHKLDKNIIEENAQILKNFTSSPTENEIFNEQYECYVCHKTYRTMLKLKSHILLHNAEQNKYHKNNEKIVAKLYECEICNKSFKTSSKFKAHKSIHTGERPFSCDICNKSFRLSSHLKEHQLVHTDVKSFSCEICNKSFKKPSKLNRHKSIHTGEKPFSCEICNKSFGLSSQLKAHQLVHTDVKSFSCEVCNKSFKNLSRLKSHKSVHTGEKPFSCDICNKSFRLSSQLKEHKLVHTDVKPFNCGVCNKSFRQSSHLKRHKLLHISKN